MITGILYICNNSNGALSQAGFVNIDAYKFTDSMDKSDKSTWDYSFINIQEGINLYSCILMVQTNTGYIGGIVESYDNKAITTRPIYELIVRNEYIYETPYIIVYSQLAGGVVKYQQLGGTNVYNTMPYLFNISIPSQWNQFNIYLDNTSQIIPGYVDDNGTTIPEYNTWASSGNELIEKLIYNGRLFGYIISGISSGRINLTENHYTTTPVSILIDGQNCNVDRQDTNNTANAVTSVIWTKLAGSQGGIASAKYWIDSSGIAQYDTSGTSLDDKLDKPQYMLRQPKRIVSFAGVQDEPTNEYAAATLASSIIKPEQVEIYTISSVNKDISMGQMVKLITKDGIERNKVVKSKTISNKSDIAIYELYA